MIDLHYWPTPNGKKVTILLEECGLPYRVVPCSIGQGDQFKPEFLAISPNNRMPAIVDHEPQGGGEPVSVFESGAILLYLVEKTGKFIPSDLRGRVATLEWLFWQVGGLRPMAGQNHHFRNYAAEKLTYAINRYVNETNRLYGVLDGRLEGRPFLAGDAYTIADMAAYPWTKNWEGQGQNIDGVTITFTDQPASIAGSVQAVSGGFDPRTSVILFPADARRWEDVHRDAQIYRIARLSTSGAFAFADVPPGDYLLLAALDDELATWADGSFLSRTAGLASRVRVTDGQRQTVTLTVKELR